MASIESFSSQGPQDILISDAPHSSSDVHLASFSFRWDLGLDCEDEDRSVSDYGTVLHTGETNLSVPLTIATGLSAVEEITEGGLTDSRTVSTANRLTLTVPPELGLLPSCNRKEFDVTKAGKSIFNRLRSAGNRVVPRLSTPWSVLAPPIVVKVQVNPSEKASSVPNPRPKNKLRKKTRPSIAITLAVEPVSSFSLAQPLARSLEALQAGTSSASVSPVAGFSSARSFFSFEFPPVFSKARSKVLQNSKYRPSDGARVINRTAIPNQCNAHPSSSLAAESRGLTSQRGHSAKNDQRAVSVDNGVGGFPTPIRSTSSRDNGGPKEGTFTNKRLRLTSPWELGLGLGKDLGSRVCNLWRARGRR